MGSYKTELSVHNRTDVGVTISISEVDSFDWDGSFRPDINFQGVTIPSGGVNPPQREDLNSNAISGSWFRMTLTFVNKDVITFRNNQRNAVEGCNQLIEVKGAQDKYCVVQEAGSGENHLYIFLKH